VGAWGGVPGYKVAVFEATCESSSKRKGAEVSATCREITS